MKIVFYDEVPCYRANMLSNQLLIIAFFLFLKKIETIYLKNKTSITWNANYPLKP